tara:strand:- start:169 stop:429 length:261 start_codon:yes stop_codon:yes gene_type:complete
MNEKEALREIEAYIAGTYGQHYAKDKKFQTTEIIFDLGHGEGFCVGNIIKYASRLNKKKGASGKSDLLKLIHYAILLYRMEITKKG